MPKLAAIFHSMKRPYRLLLCGVLIAALSVGSFFLLQTALDPYDCRILGGVSIAGLDVGGMTRSEARKALRSAAGETLLQLDLMVELPEETLAISPGEAAVKLSVRKAVDAAYRYGRTGTEEEKKAAFETGCQLGSAPYLTFDEAYVRGVLEAYAARQDTVLTQPHCEMQGTMPELSTLTFDAEAPCQTLQLTMGIPERHLDADAVLGEIIALYDRAIAAAEAGEYRITPEVPPEALPQEADLDAIYEEFYIEPVDDSLDMENYQVIPGAYGYHFDLEAAKAMAAEADYGETIFIPMECFAPEILGDGVYFRDVLGTCETRHNNNENRNTNLRLLCEFLNGHVIEPGGEFSYNAAVGERTPERGFKPAPAYSGNRLIQDYGGGVCQGSTTLYNCLLLADMEVTARVCHGAKVGYVPLGLDAAVNWATKTDLAFRNNSHFPVKIQAEVSDGYVKMKLLGTDEKDYYVKMECASSENDDAIYTASYKCKYSKKTDELLSRELEGRSTYYKNLG